MAMLKRAGARTQPCLTPLVVWRRSEILTEADSNARVLMESCYKIQEKVRDASAAQCLP